MQRRATVMSLFLAAILAVPVASQDTGGPDPTSPYDVVTNWMKPIEGAVRTPGWPANEIGRALEAN